MTRDMKSSCEEMGQMGAEGADGRDGRSGYMQVMKGCDVEADDGCIAASCIVRRMG